MSRPELIIISRDSIKEKISEYTLNNYEFEYVSKITCQNIRDNIKNVWKEAKLSLPETYIFLGQYPNAILYGLYKSDNNKIYIVKSFMDSVVSVVLFHKKYFE